MNRTFSALASTFGLILASACVQDSGGGTFLLQAHNTKQSVSGSARVIVHERWIAYLSSELTTGAGGTDFNADGDTLDQIAVLVNSVAIKEVRLDVAAEDLAIIGTHLYMVVEESEDEVDWDADGVQDDLVLLHTPCNGAGPSTPNFVATLSRSGAGPRLIATDNDRLFFMEEPPLLDPLVAPETSLALIKLAAGVPQTATRLLNDDNATTLRPELMTEDSGIVFVSLNETLEGRNLNADGDTTDDFVLALVDTTAATPNVKSVGLPVSGATSPVRALNTGSDWVVAFLVDEAAHGAVSLNDYDDFDSAWRPLHCASDDVDATDEVLHFLRFDAWFADTPNEVFNTGFAGGQRVLAAKNGANTYVATLVPEGDDGNCPVVGLTGGLNNDGDVLDNVLRWIKVETNLGSSGVFAVESGMIAVRDVPGGTHGVTDLSGRWIAVIDEAADEINWDGQVLDHNVVAWLDPSDGNGATWTVDHSICASGCGGTQAAGASWMGEERARTRTYIGFEEAVYGASINSRDLDLIDTIPTYARFDPQDSEDFDLPGPAIAVDADNAGLTVANGLGLMRVDEAADNFDWNNDGDKLDSVLFRTTVATMQNTFYLSTLSNLARPAVEADTRNVAIALLADESMAGVDYNVDGDTNDYVVRWMRVGP